MKREYMNLKQSVEFEQATGGFGGRKKYSIISKIKLKQKNTPNFNHVLKSKTDIEEKEIDLIVH